MLDYVRIHKIRMGKHYIYHMGSSLQRADICAVHTRPRSIRGRHWPHEALSGPTGGFIMKGRSKETVWDSEGYWASGLDGRHISFAAHGGFTSWVWCWHHVSFSPPSL